MKSRSLIRNMSGRFFYNEAIEHESVVEFLQEYNKNWKNGRNYYKETSSTTKKCLSCLETKSKKEFCKSKKTRDGFTNYCKQCKAMKRYKAMNRGKPLTTCVVCGKDYPERTKYYFVPGRTCKDGLSRTCRSCYNHTRALAKRRKEEASPG